jgi:hypothetical protein
MNDCKVGTLLLIGMVLGVIATICLVFLAIGGRV